MKFGKFSEKEKINWFIPKFQTDSSIAESITMGYRSVGSVVDDFFLSYEDITSVRRFLECYYVTLSLSRGGILLFKFNIENIKESDDKSLDSDLISSMWSAFSQLAYTSGFDKILFESEDQTIKYCILRTKRFLLYFTWNEAEAKEKYGLEYSFDDLIAMMQEFIRHLETNTKSVEDPREFLQPLDRATPTIKKLMTQLQTIMEKP